MFVHSFSLGLQNENIKMEMKPYLEKKTVSDEVCVSNVMERSKKFSSQLTPNVNAIHEAEDKQQVKNSKVEQALIKEIRELN